MRVGPLLGGSPAWKLSQALSRTLYACDPDSTRFALGGVCLAFSDGKLTAAGTDGRCLAVAEESAAGLSFEAPKSIKVGEEERSVAPVVPLPVVKAIIEVLSVFDLNQKLTLGFTARDGLSFTGRASRCRQDSLKGGFQPGTTFCPPESPSSAKVNPRLLEKEVKKLAD